MNNYTVNALISPVKTCGMAKWIKTKTQVYVSYRKLILLQSTHIHWKRRNAKRFYANVIPKKPGVAIHISDTL